MPSDYVARNKQMHAREVRYERNDRERTTFSGKRDWNRVPVYDRSPGLGSVNNGYDPSNKRRPSGRHGFSDNGRYGRDNSRITDHPPMFSAPAAGYPGYAHKNERYIMPQYNGARNGLKDGDDEQHHLRDRALSPAQMEQLASPSYHPPQTMHTPMHASYFEDGHRVASRYGWDPLHRLDREQRPSISPDVPDRRFSRLGWDVQDKDFDGRIDARVDARVDGRRLDRYGTSRDVFFGGDLRNSRDSSTVDVAHDFSDSLHANRFYQPQCVTAPPQCDERASSPRKRPRLGWGQGLAMYEQKKHVEADHVVESREADHQNNNLDALEEHETREEKDAASPVRDVSTPTRDPSPPFKDGSPPVKDVSEPIHDDIEDAYTPMEDDFSALSPVKEEVETVPIPIPEPPIADPGGKNEKEEHDISQPIVAASDSAPAAEMEDVTRSPCSPLNGLHQEFAKDAEAEAEAPSHDSSDEPEPTATEGMSKDVVLLQVEQFELQIDSIEKELARLDVLPEEGVAETRPVGTEETEVPMQEDQSEDVFMEEAAQPTSGSGDMVADLLEGHFTTADIARVKAAFGHLLPTGWLESGRKLYTTPQQAPLWAQNEEQHEANKHRISEQLSKQQEALTFKEKALTLKYRVFKELNKPVKRSTYRNGTNPRHGDVVSEAAHLTKKLLSDPPVPYRDVHKMPPMILDERNKPLHHIVTANRLVEDPIKYEQDRKSVNPWTAEEKQIFLEKFGIFSKSFAKIASFLDHKTVGDCVEFYYRNQKSEEFSKLRKKQKRNSRSSYMATTTPARNREANAVSLVAACAGKHGGKHTRNSSSLKVVDRERLTAVSDCVTLDAPGKHAAGKVGNLSGSIVTGFCSLSSDAQLTASTPLCEKIFLQYTRQKGARSSQNRREQGKLAGEETEAEWTDSERDLFLEAIPLFGKDFGCIAHHVRTKCEAQCKTFFIKARKRLKLDELVEQHQISQASGTIEEEKQAVNVNYMCEDPAEVVRPSEPYKTSENEDMDVSGVVDSGQKEDNGGTDAEDTTSAPPTSLADSPVSSVITSPGLACMSSPAVPLKPSEIPNGQVIPTSVHSVTPTSTSSEFPSHELPQPQQNEQLMKPHPLAYLPPFHLPQAVQPVTRQESLLTNNQLFQPDQLSQNHQMLEQAGAPTKYAFMAADLGDMDRTPASEVAKFDELHLRNGNIKLFGQSILPQPASHPTTASSLTTLSAQSEAPAAPFLLESWCSGSAESQDREYKCRANGTFQNGSFPIPAGVSEKLDVINSSSSSSSSNWQTLNGATCTLDLHGSSCVGLVAPQQCQQQQQQQGLKDGVVYGPSHLLQFGNSWGGLGNSIHQHHQHALQSQHQQQQQQQQQVQQIQQQPLQQQQQVQQQQMQQRPRDPGS